MARDRARPDAVGPHREPREGGERAFDATLALQRRALTARRCARVTARYPAATLRVLALIYGHALGLQLRGVAAPTRTPGGAGMTERERGAARALHALARADPASAALTIVEGERRGGLRLAAPPQATVVVHSPRLWRSSLRGSRGMAEAYADGLWDSPDLTAVIELAARNMRPHRRAARRAAPLREPLPARPCGPARATRRQRAPRATSPPTTTSATSCSRSCSTRR